MNPIELKRKQVEILRLQASKAESEFKIMERLEDIERIKANMAIQDARIAELQAEMEPK